MVLVTIRVALVLFFLATMLLWIWGENNECRGDCADTVRRGDAGAVVHDGGMMSKFEKTREYNRLGEDVTWRELRSKADAMRDELLFIIAERDVELDIHKALAEDLSNEVERLIFKLEAKQ